MTTQQSSRRRPLRTVATTLSAAIVLSGLTLTAASASSQTVTQLAWWNLWSGSILPMTNALVTAFNATHPSIHVTQLNIPSAGGDAKLLSSVAAGDPPDVYTEFNNVNLGAYAQEHVIQPLNPYLTGKYAGLAKYFYPAVLQGGAYSGKLYGFSMGEGSVALYYNKSMLKAAGINTPPSTLAELDTDQSKLWKISGGRVSQIGFYPPSGDAFQFLQPFFGVHEYKNGKYDLASNPRALAEMNWLASFSKYPFSSVAALEAAYGTAGGGTEDPFDMGHQAFDLIGYWEGYINIPANNPAMKTNFGVEPFPQVPGGPAV